MFSKLRENMKKKWFIKAVAVGYPAAPALGR